MLCDITSMSNSLIQFKTIFKARKFDLQTKTLAITDNKSSYITVSLTITVGWSDPLSCLSDISVRIRLEVVSNTHFRGKPKACVWGSNLGLKVDHELSNNQQQIRPTSKSCFNVFVF